VPVGAGSAGTAEHPEPSNPAPRNGKDSDWGYAWIPVVGPLVGGAIAGLLSQVVF